MNLLPVIERELRAEARRAGTQWLRPLSAGVALGLAAFILLFNTPVLRPGPELFTELHHCLFIITWLLVPFMTADCVSREKREQTLGLLFLTPLRAGEILMAKVLAHGLRAVSVCAAVLPVLILPLLVGGVAWPVMVSALLTNAGAFLWALAAGILASVLSRSVLGSMGWALALSLLFVVGHALFTGLAVHLSTFGSTRWPPSFTWVAGVGLLAMWDPDQLHTGFVRVGRTFRLDWILASGGVVLAAGMGLALIWWVGAWILKRTWQELPPSPQRERVTREFARPRFALELFRSIMRRRMERNPVGWLEHRRWTSRAAFWGWLGLLAVAQTIVLGKFPQYHELKAMTQLLGVALIGLLAMVSAASLLRERENGVLELLLTTPLSARQIVRGRLRGIWFQFLPSFLWLGGTTWFIRGFIENLWGLRADTVCELTIVAMFYLAVPVGGLWLSLRSRHYVSGLLLTIGVMGVLPWICLLALQRLGWQEEALVLCLPLGVLGVVQLRSSLGKVGSLLLAAGLVVMLLVSVESPSGYRVTRGPRGPRGPQRNSMMVGLILPCLLLAVAGEAHRRLLRDLGSATASRRKGGPERGL